MIRPSKDHHGNWNIDFKWHNSPTDCVHTIFFNCFSIWTGRNSHRWLFERRSSPSNLLQPILSHSHTAWRIPEDVPCLTVSGSCQLQCLPRVASFLCPGEECFQHDPSCPSHKCWSNQVDGTDLVSQGYHFDNPHRDTPSDPFGKQHE